jgi:hypothetical protein
VQRLIPRLLIGAAFAATLTTSSHAAGMGVLKVSLGGNIGAAIPTDVQGMSEGLTYGARLRVGTPLLKGELSATWMDFGDDEVSVLGQPVATFEGPMVTGYHLNAILNLGGTPLFSLYSTVGVGVMEAEYEGDDEGLVVPGDEVREDYESSTIAYNVGVGAEVGFGALPIPVTADVGARFYYVDYETEALKAVTITAGLWYSIF